MYHLALAFFDVYTNLGESQKRFGRKPDLNLKELRRELKAVFPQTSRTFECLLFDVEDLKNLITSEETEDDMGIIKWLQDNWYFCFLIDARISAWIEENQERAEKKSLEKVLEKLNKDKSPGDKVKAGTLREVYEMLAKCNGKGGEVMNVLKKIKEDTTTSLEEQGWHHRAIKPRNILPRKGNVVNFVPLTYTIIKQIFSNLDGKDFEELEVNKKRKKGQKLGRTRKDTEGQKLKARPWVVYGVETNGRDLRLLCMRPGEKSEGMEKLQERGYEELKERRALKKEGKVSGIYRGSNSRKTTTASTTTG